MQFQQIQPKTKVFLSFLLVALAMLLPTVLFAQVNTVELEKTGYSTVSSNGNITNLPISIHISTKMVKPLPTMLRRWLKVRCPPLEQFVEYGLQRRANIVIYNHFDELNNPT